MRFPTNNLNHLGRSDVRSAVDTNFWNSLSGLEIKACPMRNHLVPSIEWFCHQIDVTFGLCPLSWWARSRSALPRFQKPHPQPQNPPGIFYYFILGLDDDQVLPSCSLTKRETIPYLKKKIKKNCGGWPGGKTNGLDWILNTLVLNFDVILQMVNLDLDLIAT